MPIDRRIFVGNCHPQLYPSFASCRTRRTRIRPSLFRRYPSLVYPRTSGRNPERTGPSGRSPFCKAIGEAGLDKFVSTSLFLQRELFVRQAELAAAHRLPVIVHCVKAWDELLSARKDIPAAAVCIIHGFRGNPQLAESLLGKGFYLSFGFRFHPQSLTLCPSDRLFFESDEDSRPVDTLYRTAAELRSCTPEELRTQCWENLVRIGPSSKK